MRPRETFDRAMAAINAGDADALLALYAPDAEQVGYDGVASGRDALAPAVREWLAARPRVREVAYAEGADTIVFEATDGQTRGYGTLVLREGLIWRETVGTLPAPTAETAAGGHAPVELEAYREWATRDVPDPRSAGRDALMAAVAEIVEVEGPVLARRAFALYTRASGGQKTTAAAKAPLAGAAWRLKIAGRLAIEPEGVATIGDETVLRSSGSPAVAVRELGPRALEDVPLAEVSALMDRLGEGGAADLKRAVLGAYGLIRMTSRADAYLERALAARP